MIIRNDDSAASPLAPRPDRSSRPVSSSPSLSGATRAAPQRSSRHLSQAYSRGAAPSRQFAAPKRRSMPTRRAQRAARRPHRGRLPNRRFSPEPLPDIQLEEEYKRTRGAPAPGLHLRSSVQSRPIPRSLRVNPRYHPRGSRPNWCHRPPAGGARLFASPAGRRCHPRNGSDVNGSVAVRRRPADATSLDLSAFCRHALVYEHRGDFYSRSPTDAAPAAAQGMLDGGGESNLGFARVDLGRHRRCGIPEVIFCTGKTADQVGKIASAMVAAGQNVAGDARDARAGEGPARGPPPRPSPTRTRAA